MARVESRETLGQIVVDSGNRRYSRYRAEPYADAPQAIEDQAGRADWNQPPAIAALYA